MADIKLPDWLRLLPDMPQGPQTVRDLIDASDWQPEAVTTWAGAWAFKLDCDASDQGKEALALHKATGYGSAHVKAMESEAKRRCAMALRFWRRHGCPHEPDTLISPKPKRLRKGKFQ